MSNTEIVQTEEKGIEVESKAEMGRPLKYRSGKELEREIDKWKENCIAKDEQPTMIGLAVWLKIAESTLWNYKRKDFLKGVIEEAKAFVEASAVKCLFDKNKPTAGVIFYLSSLRPDRYALASRQQIEQKSMSKIEIRIRKD